MQALESRLTTIPSRKAFTLSNGFSLLNKIPSKERPLLLGG